MWSADSRPIRMALPQWNLYLKIYAYADMQTWEEQDIADIQKHASAALFVYLFFVLKPKNPSFASCLGQ